MSFYKLSFEVFILRRFPINQGLGSFTIYGQFVRYSNTHVKVQYELGITICCLLP